MTTLWYHGLSTIFLETPVFMFSLLRIFDVIFDKIIDVVERFCFPLWHPWQYLLSKIQKCLNFVPLFLSASIKKEGLIIVSRRNCVILDDPDILTKQNAPLLIWKGRISEHITMVVSEWMQFFTQNMSTSLQFFYSYAYDMEICLCFLNFSSSTKFHIYYLCFSMPLLFSCF